ncbi:F-box/FBD/LRR-repeat protein At1g13570-like [Rutidosis leptorrhynchoides]|uniref:F-box/FBD/LRR-repeat protein At1g13570-like n=1 Tax=Rutidosis leptorrhynchoides TaxID=125765 RepID=UPI003A99B4BC
MDSVFGKHKTSKSAFKDIISSMPEDVITNILNRLPIQYAVTTSTLSRNWRFKWTSLSHVVLDKEFFDFLRGLGVENWYSEMIISQILHHLKGSITKFDLFIPYDKVLDVNTIDHWLMLLSKKGIKELKLINMYQEPLRLSSNLFSCVKLERLTLGECSIFSAQTTVCGFPNLLHLDLDCVEFVKEIFGEIITQCPLLECLQVGRRFPWDPSGKVKIDEIAKLKNLKCLWLPLCLLDNITITSSLVFHLVDHFSKLQVLYLDLSVCEFLGESSARDRVGTSSFSCLSTLKLDSIDSGNDDMLSFAFDMIWGSPKLHTLKITSAYAVPPPASSALKHISTRQLKHLRIVEFKDFGGSESEINMIKNILACSPMLNKIDIYLCSVTMYFGDNYELMFATKLLPKLHRASSAAQMNIIDRSDEYDVLLNSNI